MENPAFQETRVLRKIQLCFDNFASLKKGDILSRQAVLKEIEQLFTSCKENVSADDEWVICLENSVKCLCVSLCDESEKCRDISAKILNSLFESLTVPENCLPFIFTTLARRLGKSDEREPSEEVRLLEVQFIYKLIHNYDRDLLKHLNDISCILSVCITDEYPEVKRKSCECTSCLAQNQKSNFHMISSSLLKPLLHTVSHQHFRTRSICVKTIGTVVCYGSNQDFEDAILHIAQRLFDYSPIVRISVTEVIGLWLLTLTDRYSYFNQLIPLMLSTLYDEVLDVRTKAVFLWNKVGEQYLKEYENDYKDLIDYPKPGPDNYPETEKRPPLGCRILVQRNMFNILPALIRDITDWVPATRMKSAQVLYSLILHAEDKATMQLPKIIEGVVSAAKDEEKGISKLALQCAEMLGFLLDPNILCDSVMTLVYKSPSAVNFSILAAVLKGNKKGLPPKCFQAICKLLSDPVFCRVRQAEEQANLLLCIDGVLSSHNKIDYVTSHQIFTILCTVSGLTTNNSVLEKAASLLQDLTHEQSGSLESLFKTHAISLLKTLISSNELWTSDNPELPIFYFLVQSEYVDEEVFKLALPVMTTNLDVKKDVKLRSKVFTLLIKVFKRLPTSEDNELSEKVLNLLCDGIFPNLVWAPGKAAKSLKTVAVASLYEIVRKDCIDKSMLKLIADKLLPVLTILSGNEEIPNRLLACKILEFFLPKLHGYVDDYKIHAVCHDYLLLMDDVSDDIRIITTKVLNAYIKAFPNDYNWSSYRTYLKEMYQNVLIHMDDKNEKIRESVLSLLKDVAFVDPQLLLDEIEEKKYLMAAGDYCDNLIDHIKQLHINNK